MPQIVGVEGMGMELVGRNMSAVQVAVDTTAVTKKVLRSSDAMVEQVTAVGPVTTKTPRFW